MTSQLRIGQGYDVHAFTTGDHVTLGGEKIPHTHGILAHSDGDVLLHAICDALLGAAGLGDIGMHFPDTDSQWRGADSRVFLRRVHELLAERLSAERLRWLLVEQRDALAGSRQLARRDESREPRTHHDHVGICHADQTSRQAASVRAGSASQR